MPLQSSLNDASARRRAALFIVTAGLLAACGGGGSSGSPPLPAPSPPPPVYVGAVYAGTNNNGPAGNAVVGFTRQADGTLVPLDAYVTGGVGRALTPSPPRLNPLIAEDSIIVVENQFLLVVNAGSNDVTCFIINSDFSLRRTSIAASGGTMPISLAYHNGVVYVANADEDGTFSGPPNQSGNVTALWLDFSNGQLTPIPGSSLSLRGRPADLEVTPDGSYLIVSSLNAASPLLPQPTAAEVSSYRIQADGTLAATPAGTGASTQIGNAGGRNLPNAIGIETFAEAGRQFVIAAEARTASSLGVPAANFAAVQTASISTWELAADGSFAPRSQDFLLGPSFTSGPLQAGFLANSRFNSTFWVSTSAGATISGFFLHPDGTIGRVEPVVSGIPVDPAAASPLANADGYGDIAISRDGRWLYQLVGLKGRIDVYEIDTLVAFKIALRQQVTTPLLPMDNLQGLVVMDRP